MKTPDAASTISLTPVQPTERVFEIDVLRGCALFGVLMAYALWNLGGPPESSLGQVEQILNAALSILIDTKAYTVFAFLFGLGFSIQLNRAATRGVNIVRLYIRRLLALLLIGLAHAVLLRNGDILVPYAVTGFLLLVFRNASNKILLAVSIVAVFYPSATRIIWELTGSFPQRPDTTGVGHFASNIAWLRYWYLTAIVYWPGALPMFLFGLYIGRRRLFENLDNRRKSIKWALIVGLVSAVLFMAANFMLLSRVSELNSMHKLVGSVFYKLHSWGLATFYCSSILLLLRRNFWRRLFRPIGAVGRMALTNYLLQALFIVPVCIAFDLYDKVTPTIGLAMAAVVWAVQVPASFWWLKHFRFGPAEWLWRSLTYGRRQPMRRGAEPVSEKEFDRMNRIEPASV